MTDSLWELPIVMLVSVAVFFSAWHFAAHFLS
jgi:hypothetical protein